MDSGLDTQRLGNAKLLLTHCGAFYHINPPRGPIIHMHATVQKFNILKIQSFYVQRVKILHVLLLTPFIY